MSGSRFGSTAVSILIMAIYSGHFLLLFKKKWPASPKEVSWRISAVVGNCSRTLIACSTEQLAPSSRCLDISC